MNVPEVTRERVLTRDKNGDFSRRGIDALFRLTTMDWSRIFAVMRGATYLQTSLAEPDRFWGEKRSGQLTLSVLF